MNPIVQIFAVVVGVGIVWFSIKGLRERTLSELQTGVWLFAGIVAIILGIFPGIVMWVAQILGITWPPAILLLLAIVALGLMLFGRTQEINELSSRQVELTERLSIALHEADRLQHRVEKLEKAVQGQAPEARKGNPDR